ncbi:hypothetical protein AVT29_gp72 [Streptomyces phage Amela]|uniref:Uncharacterized protein n=4 Tax=Camvirus TaxID=1982879 RepID=A0A0K1Y9R2_9CAUD|nr:hypothetical protein AVT29_gp72 [Streptomyces phage Amela]AKY03827.1 hypothetical protein SEA_AMELA_72 [Streptomyces phage Amela]
MIQMVPKFRDNRESTRDDRRKGKALAQQRKFARSVKYAAPEQFSTESKEF